MRFLALALLLCTLVSAQLRKAPPRFEDYATTEWYSQKSPPVQFETDEQRKHGRELRLAEIRLPNSATFYHLIQFQCGTGCERLALVDGRSGKIHGSPFANQESQFYLPPSNWDPKQPMGFGRLLQVPNVCPNGPSSCATFYFAWENDKFRLIEKVPVSAVPVVPPKSPFIGTWEGAWSYTTGWGTTTNAFRLVVAEDAKGRLYGTYLDKTKLGKLEKVRGFVQTKPDKSAYRANIEGSCWNFHVESNQLNGVWNGGPCTEMGVGVGARLIGFEAKRAPN